MSRYALLCAAGLVGIGACPGAALAETKADDGQNAPVSMHDRVTAGVGLASVPSYIGSDQNVIVPMAAAQGQVAGVGFELEGTSLSLDFVPHGDARGFKIQAGPVASLRLDRTTKIRDHAVRALGELSTAVELGGWIGVQKTGVITSPYDTLSASLSYQHDVAGAHRSYIVSPEIDYDTPLSHRLYASLSVSADYVGRRFGAYYYDIDAAGSRASGLPTYSGADKAGWKDWNANLMVARSITGDLTHGMKVFASAGYGRLLGRYARSPVVAIAGRRGQPSFAIGLGYTF